MWICFRLSETPNLSTPAVRTNFSRAPNPQSSTVSSDGFPVPVSMAWTVCLDLPIRSASHIITDIMSWIIGSEGPTATLSHRMFTSEQYRVLQLVDGGGTRLEGLLHRPCFIQFYILYIRSASSGSNSTSRRSRQRVTTPLKAPGASTSNRSGADTPSGQ